MPEDRIVRTVTLEFLRAGTPHNQLLSPLTPYLAVCGEAGAQVVHVPWEHAKFLRRLEEMRYEQGTDEDSPRRLAVLEEVGNQVARLLGSIPALSGVLGNEPVEGEVLHLRLILSASELGLIPYELSKVPTGLQLPAGNWLLLQAGRPVCLTRHVRSVPYGGVAWDRRPRILFVASDPEELPYEQHRDALVEAARPWLHPGQEDKPHRTKLGEERYAYHYGDVLTVVPGARIQDVRELCERETYTHVHVLAHGGVDDTAERLSYGIGLHGEIITGNRFATAITTATDRPAVATIACCDSANVGSVISAGASFAHSLHEHGIPVVVASQFPLSFEGSVTAVQRMYGESDGFLRGGNPVFMLHELRRSLQITNEPHSHDWASVVVYEALPPDLPEQLVTYDHIQAERELRAAEERLGAVRKRLRVGAYTTIAKELSAARGACTRARAALGADGPYAIEALALKGASYTKLAEVEFRLAAKPRLGPEKKATHMRRCHEALDSSYERYRNAAAGFLNPEVGNQKKAQLHYVTAQALSLGLLLGKEEVATGFWELSRLSARAHARLPDDEERAWALGTLLELNLLGIVDPKLGPHARSERYQKRALEHADAMVDLIPRRGQFVFFSTYRQLRRYTEWWATPPFLAYLKQEGVQWRSAVEGGWNQVAEIAEQLKKILEPRLWKNQLKG